ncbi:hypothetical protein BVC80_1537g15 [Macleaya cordata]|uniref:R13L1/DRL21-like LRR repeat region domain-containing protein n=1 Tax=Macleaya cordata TaxID=56857 RepID=A0A200R9F5_MACCD|nr:hypothetical protein BVC80_1537g15 [Macleaya cordata]
MLYNLQTLVLDDCLSLEELPRNIGCLKILRHLISLNFTKIQVLPESITSLHNLRTLNLSFYNRFEGLPSEFGALQQLRCIDLTAANIKVLPDSITNCHSLQILKLRCCNYLESLPSDVGVLKHLSGLNDLETLKLGRCKLPKDIKNWRNLKHLIYVGDREWTETPRRIGKLAFLETLPEYVVSKDIEYGGGGIGELEGLNLLEGEVKIRNLENVRDGEDAQRANLKGKKKIHHLKLHWGYRSSPDDFDPFSKFSSFPCLEKISIIRCLELTTIPTLFPSLKKLKIDCSNGKVVSSVVRSSLTSLTSLDIFYAPELVFLPQGLLQSNNLLQSLRISSCPDFQGFCLYEDVEEGLSSPHFNNSSLQSLELDDCPILTSLPDIRGLTSLQILSVRGCNELKSLSNDLKCLTSIKSLNVDSIQRS